MPLMVSISGLRGVVGETLTPEVAIHYASAFAEYCARHSAGAPTIVVGGDGRRTGAMVTSLVNGALVAKGANVISLGICPTPTVQLAVEHGGAAGGIAVTASHNPMEWNGLKFIAPSGMFLNAEENKEFWSLVPLQQDYRRWKDVGAIANDGTWHRRHLDAVLNLPLLNPEVIRRRKFTVVLDCINAAGGTIVPRLLDELGCTVLPMNCDVSGIFARTPEPIPENLTAVASRVREDHADLGIVVDPDVDRLVLINDRGEPFGEEYTITAATDFVLRKLSKAGGSRPKVVVNLSTTRAVEDVAARNGADCLRTPVGEINVARKMKEIGAVIGGEGSGGVILPAVHLGRDAIVGIGLILQSLAESGGSISRLKETLPHYAIAKGKIPVDVVPADAVIAKLEKEFGGTAKINREDGVRFDFPEYWIHLRKSNTEPIMRVIAEAPTEARARDVVTRLLDDIATMKA